MTNAQALKRALQMAKEDGIHTDEARLEDILDYLAICGVPGASKAYLELMRNAREVAS